MPVDKEEKKDETTKNKEDETTKKKVEETPKNKEEETKKKVEEKTKKKEEETPKKKEEETMKKKEEEAIKKKEEEFKKKKEEDVPKKKEDDTQKKKEDDTTKKKELDKTKTKVFDVANPDKKNKPADVKTLPTEPEKNIVGKEKDEKKEKQENTKNEKETKTALENPDKDLVESKNMMKDSTEKTKLMEKEVRETEKNGLPLDKLSTTCETKGKDDSSSVNKSKEDSLSTATTKAAEDKSTEATPLKGSPQKFQGVNARLVFAVSAAAFGSAFQHGYNLGVINAPLQLMGSWLNETTYERSGEYLTETGTTMIISWIVSIYCIGGMIGGSLTGFFSERYGRKGGLLLNNIFAVAAAIMFGFCKMAGSWEMIIIGRFIIGINNGLNAGLAPMYLSEIAPNNLRGAIGTVYQLVVTISILLSQIMGLKSLLGTEDLWPVLLALTILPAIFQLCTLPICPESAKFLLINKEQRLEAQRALTWLRDTSNVHEELEEIQNEAEAQKLVPKVSVREIVTNPALRIPLIISIMMMLAQQLSGINAAIFFSVKIYESAGLDEKESLYATIAMGSMNVLMTLVSLVLVERAGRKTLMLAGMGGMMIDTILLTICLACQSEDAKWLSYASIVLVILFVVMFATGPGSIPWFLVNELFASNARPTASSIAVAVNWTAAFLVGIGFLPIQQALGPYVFLVFSALLAFFIAFIIKKVPETKGRSIDEITAMFKQQAYGGGGVNMV